MMFGEAQMTDEFLCVQITSNASSDLNIKSEGKAIVRGNEGVHIMGRTVEFKSGGNIELRAVSVTLATGV